MPNTLAYAGLILIGGLGVGIQQLVMPRLDHFGYSGRVVPSIANDKCKAIPELIACEEQWIHRPTGLSYLPCSSIESRMAWVPAMDHLNASKVDSLPSDTVYIYDTSSGLVKPIEILNRPPHLEKLHLHGIDGFVDPVDSKKVTFFLNNHAVPQGIALGDVHKHGAESTIEVFESRLGETRWKHVKTIRDRLILTPNNIVATGHGSFYVTNDHPAKTGLVRQSYILSLPTGHSSIVYCSFGEAGSGSHGCIEAFTGLLYPNGIARGPSSDSPYPSIYVGSVATGRILSLSADADGLLHEVETVAELGRAIDNIQVDEHGSIIAATIPIVKPFIARAVIGSGPSATEVWKVSNNTGEGSFYGHKYVTKRIFADPGEVTPGTTNAQLYKGKLYLTGITTSALFVCDLS